MPDKNTIVIGTNPNRKSREQLANALMAQGVSTAPVGHWTQALARMAQAYAGKGISDEMSATDEAQNAAARETLQKALAGYRGDTETPIMSEAAGPVQPGQMPPTMQTGTQMVPGSGANRDKLIEIMQQNPDTQDLINSSQLSTILAGADEGKIPSGYRKAANGGIEQIPGWVNSSRYKPLSYTDENGNLINSMVDVGAIQPGNPVQPVTGPGAAPSGGPVVGPNGVINLGQKKPATMPPETAGKAALLQQGMKDIKDANQLLFKEDGSFDRVNAANAWLNTPYTQGRDIRGRYKTALSGKIYVTTGAVASPDELSDNMDSFMPGPFDNADTAQDKAVRLNEFLNTTLLRMDESGRLVPQDTDLANWMKNSLRRAKDYKSQPSGTSQKPKTPVTDADYNAIKPGEYFIDPDDGKVYIK